VTVAESPLNVVVCPAVGELPVNPPPPTKKEYRFPGVTATAAFCPLEPAAPPPE
jgi:hypothetical protein